MNGIVKRLQKEAGLTQEQAGKVLSILKSYIDEEQLNMDWDKFFKGKFSDFKETIVSFFSNYDEKYENFNEKISHKIEDIEKEKNE